MKTKEAKFAYKEDIRGGETLQNKCEREGAKREEDTWLLPFPTTRVLGIKSTLLTGIEDDTSLKSCWADRGEAEKNRIGEETKCPAGPLLTWTLSQCRICICRATNYSLIILSKREKELPREYFHLHYFYILNFF